MFDYKKKIGTASIVCAAFVAGIVIAAGARAVSAYFTATDKTNTTTVTAGDMKITATLAATTQNSADGSFLPGSTQAYKYTLKKSGTAKADIYQVITATATPEKDQTAKKFEDTDATGKLLSINMPENILESEPESNDPEKPVLTSEAYVLKDGILKSIYVVHSTSDAINEDNGLEEAFAISLSCDADADFSKCTITCDAKIYAVQAANMAEGSSITVDENGNLSFNGDYSVLEKALTTATPSDTTQDTTAEDTEKQ